MTTNTTRTTTRATPRMALRDQFEAAHAALARGARQEASHRCTIVAQHIADAPNTTEQWRRAERAVGAGFLVGKEPWGWRVSIDAPTDDTPPTFRRAQPVGLRHPHASF